jgi:hypothetical protein
MMMRRFFSTVVAEAPKRRVRENVRVGPINGRLRRNMDLIPVIHQSQRPAQTANIDFEAIGLTYKMNLPVKFVVERLAWSPQPETSPDLPFGVDRTLTGKALPVYTEYIAGGTKVVTLLRKCKGDIGILKAEVEKVVGKTVEVKAGKLLIEGNYDRRLKTWLTGLGF